MRIRAQVGVLVDIVVDVHNRSWRVACRARAVEATLVAAHVCVWVQAITAAVLLSSGRASWAVSPVFVAHVGHGCEQSERKAGNTGDDRMSKRQEYDIATPWQDGGVFLIGGGKGRQEGGRS